MTNMKITLLTGKTFDIAKEAGFKLDVVVSKQARKLSLRIDAKRRIPVLTIPRFCSKRQAVAFVQGQKPWIDFHLSRLPYQKNFADGYKISFNGADFEIKHCAELRGGVQIKDGKILVSGNKEFLSRRVRDFIKEQAQKILYERSVEKAVKLGKKVNRVVIKDTTSRWGSCSSLQNINYNWRIMLAPSKVIDYLVAHEVSHLAHQDHSEEFWNCVDELSEDMVFGRNWLKKHGSELNEYA